MAAQKRLELRDFMNQTTAAEMLGVSRMTIWKWLKNGKIQAVIVAGLRMIPRAEVERVKREMIEAAD